MEYLKCLTTYKRLETPVLFSALIPALFGSLPGKKEEKIIQTSEYIAEVALKRLTCTSSIYQFTSGTSL